MTTEAQKSLFDAHGYARAGHKTQQAALTALRGTLGRKKSLVFDTVLAFSRDPLKRGATRYEIAAATGLPIQSVCARIGELLREGRVKRTERSRRSPFGQAAEVLEAMESPE